jgi:uncharacterized caspase-like protein
MKLSCQAVGCLSLLFAMLVPALRAQDQDERCGVGKDLVVQALERAGPGSSPAEFADALQLLKRAVAECATLGDAWYYRSLVEARLGHGPQAKFAAGKATFVGSEAQNENLQPFVLATPPVTRGFEVEKDASRGAAPPAAIPGAPGKPGPVHDKWALVIGVGQFADQSIRSLRYTTADAKAFAALLTDPAVGRFPKANVHVLTDAAATTKAIKAELNWIARHAEPDDIVVIYVATHGSPRKLDSVGGLNYLLTYDTEVRSNQEPDQDSLYATAFPMVELSSAVATRMRALRTLVVLDTCFSGGSIKSGDRMMGPGLANASPSPEVLSRMSEGSGRIVLAASRVDQESLESDKLQHGYFTYFLLQVLRESKGRQPISQVFAKVRQQVADQVKVDFGPGGFHQDPVIDQSSVEADFALNAEATRASVNERERQLLEEAILVHSRQP